ncbi:MAG: MFS transporter [Coriobacteriia bacterium]|nr:MFS transporter [Coriobacteriia bacterium]MBN2822022.1 MFS transporter [Coriobacteriia bacterium]
MAAGRLWVPLRSKDYRMLWLGQLVSVVGDKVNQIAMGILVYEATGSMLQMGVMLAISTLPAALFGLPAGAFVDRSDRRATMIAADLLRAGLVLSIPLVVKLGIPAVYAVAFLVSTISLFFEPAKLSLIPEIVPEDELMAANSLDNATMSVSELFGLAFAGALVAILGYKVAFFLDAATFVISAVFVSFISFREVRQIVEQERIRLVEDIMRGLRHINDVPLLKDLMGVYAIAAMGVAASVTAVYLLALQRYNAGAPGLAILDSAITIGLLLGSFSVGRTTTEASGRKFLLGLCAFGLFFGAVALAPSVAIAVPLLLVGGIANMWFQVPMATMIQKSSSGALRGRVFAAKATVSRLFTVVGFIGAGLLAERIGLGVAIAIIGGMVLVTGLAGFSRHALRTA